MKALPIRLPLSNESFQSLVDVDKDQLFVPDCLLCVDPEFFQLLCDSLIAILRGDQEQPFAAFQAFPRVSTDVLEQRSLIRFIELKQMLVWLGLV